MIRSIVGISYQMTKQVYRGDDAAKEALAILQVLLHDYRPRDFTICFWDGSQWPAETGSAQFRLIFRHPDALRCMLGKTSAELPICEAYICDNLDVEGSLEAAISVAYHLTGRGWPASTVLRVGWKLLRMPAGSAPRPNGRQPARLHGKPHSIERDRQAVTYHYNLSNDFYALWLDRRMIYSCAYFESADEDLDPAQSRKIDYLCRKLRLGPGDHLLDIGCGWGGLVIHAAQHYGVNALGITLSRNQADLANERIAQAGLHNRCRVQVCDYRDLNETGTFDKLVSVGMFEHVGEHQLPRYFQRAWQLLRPGGVFLNHGIARREIDRQSAAPTFMSRYVFPDSELVPINRTLRYAEETGFEARDVESLREHYTLTLRHWARRLELHHDEVLQVVDQPTYRVWRLFLSGAAHGFSVGWLNVYQTLLLKPDEGRSGLPLTRADWYR